MSEEPKTPPSWFGEAVVSEPEITTLPYNDVAYATNVTVDAWYGSPRLRDAIKMIGGNPQKVVLPSMELDDALSLLKRYNTKMQWLDGVETIYRDFSEDWKPANGTLEFQYLDEKMHIIVLADYLKIYYSNWFLSCDNMAIGAAFLEAVRNSKKEGAHRECWMIGNRSVRSDSLLKEVDRLTWDDLVMDEKPKSDLRACCESVFSDRTAAIYERMGLPRKKGLIIHGPPGNGKTMTGKVVAGVTGASLIYVTTSRQPGFLRDRTPAEIFEEVYAKAHKLAPCVVMLEEIDGLIDKDSRPVLLTILDGLVPNDGVLTIATTNYVSRLDPALVNRPSRFDRVFEFGYPSMTPRRQYMERRMKQALGIPEDEPIDATLRRSISKTAKLTEGLSFSHLQEIIVGAASHVTEKPSDGASKALNLSTERILDCFKKEQLEHTKPSLKKRTIVEQDDDAEDTTAKPKRRARTNSISIDALINATSSMMHDSSTVSWVIE